VRPLLVRLPEQLPALPVPCYLIVADEDVADLARRGVALPPHLNAGQFYGDPYRVYLLAEPLSLAARNDE